MKKTFHLIVILLTLSNFVTAQKSNIGTLTNDGAWCWFSDPRAVYLPKEKMVVTGWVKMDGSVEAASLNVKSNEIKSKILYPQLQYDDHNNPAFVVLPDRNILAMYTWHSTDKGVVYNITSAQADISSFGDPIVFKPKTDQLLKDFPRETYTYANPYVLKKEQNRIYSFGRWIGYKPNMVMSDDNGKTWHTPRVIISPTEFDPNNRPYVKYFSDGQSKIHLVYTDGHPRNEPGNSVYYCYYEKGAFYRVDGSKISDVQDLPFATNEASLVYKPAGNSGLAWIADIVADKNNQPVILYTRHPTETDHRYHYARYDKKTGQWIDHEICKAGPWFPQTQPNTEEREQHYFGNMTIHPARPNEIYLSRQIDGIFEIEKRTTHDGGNTWEIEAITSHSAYDNVRPYVPRHTSAKDKTVVLWMENKKYIHYTDYDVAMKYVVME
jgi:hypothetical protein